MSTKSTTFWSGTELHTKEQLEARGFVPIEWELMKIGVEHLGLVFPLVISTRPTGYSVMEYYATPEDLAACLVLWETCVRPEFITSVSVGPGGPYR